MNEKMKRFIINLVFGIVVFALGNLIVNIVSKYYGIGVVVTKSLDKDYIIYQLMILGTLICLNRLIKNV